MSKDAPDEECLTSKVDFGDHSVPVPGNIKHHVGAHPVRAPKNLPHLRKALPLTARANPIPIVESGARVRTSRLELSDRLVTYDVHVPPCADVPIKGTYLQAFSSSSARWAGFFRSLPGARVTPATKNRAAFGKLRLGARQRISLPASARQKSCPAEGRRSKGRTRSLLRRVVHQG